MYLLGDRIYTTLIKMETVHATCHSNQTPSSLYSHKKKLQAATRAPEYLHLLDLGLSCGIFRPVL